MEPRLSRKQIEKFRSRLAPILSFLYRCKQRMLELGFTDRDEVFRAVDKAHRDVNGLNFELHYDPVDHREERRVDSPPPGDKTF